MLDGEIVTFTGTGTGAVSIIPSSAEATETKLKTLETLPGYQDAFVNPESPWSGATEEQASESIALPDGTSVEFNYKVLGDKYLVKKQDLLNTLDSILAKYDIPTKASKSLRDSLRDQINSLDIPQVTTQDELWLTKDQYDLIKHTAEFVYGQTVDFILGSRKESSIKKVAELGEKLEDHCAYIYLTRHGNTDFNTDNKLRGWTDIDLNDLGYKQAEELGNIFDGAPITRIYSSDLQRAVHTAEPIMEVTGAKLIKTQELRPIDFGEWNGKSLDEVEPKMKELQEQWKKDPSITAPGGESFESYQKRQISIFDKILSEIKPNEHVMITAHLRNCVYYMAYILKGRKPLEGEDLALLNNLTQDVGTVSVITYSKDKDEVQLENQNTQDEEALQMKKSSSAPGALSISAGFNLFKEYDYSGGTWDLDKQSKTIKRKPTISVESAVRNGGAWSYNVNDEVIVDIDAIEYIPVIIEARLPNLEYQVRTSSGATFNVSEKNIVDATVEF